MNKKWKYRPKGYKDIGFKKGTVFTRVTSKTNSKTKSKNKDIRKYLSFDPGAYMDDEYIYLDKNGKIIQRYMETYKTTKNIKLAGEHTVNKVLKKMGYKKMYDPYNDPGTIDKNGTTRDFFMTNYKVSKKVVDELKRNGYSGLVDPVDSDTGIGVSNMPVIITDNVIRKIGSVKIDKGYDHKIISSYKKKYLKMK